MGGGRRLVGCGQIFLASNSKANGLNEAIPSQVVHIVVLNKLILLKDVKKLIVLPTEGYPVANTRRFTNARKNHCSVIVKMS